MKKRAVAMGMALGLIGLFVMAGVAFAGGGGGASELVVVADTRMIHNSLMRYIADLYNTNVWLFAVWAVVLTAAYGSFLGFLMDFIMERTGLDLKSRKIVEH